MLRTQNGLFLSKAPFVSPLSTTGMVEAVATGQVRIASTFDSILFQSGNRDVLNVASNNVIVNANLIVNGSIDSFFSSDLVIRDKTLVIAAPEDVHGSNVSMFDKSILDGAGILLGGTSDVLEKSLRWEAGSEHIGDAWTFRGGGLQILASSTSTKGEVVYGFVINDQLELELYATMSNNAGMSRRCVATFGPPRLSNISQSNNFLPSSPYPWT